MSAIAGEQQRSTLSLARWIWSLRS